MSGGLKPQDPNATSRDQPRAAERPRVSAPRLISALALIGSVSYLLMYLWVALSRVSTPFEIEWMEGGMIAHALRLREGSPIYAPPSLDFVPFFYTPGYPALIYALGEHLTSITGGVSFTLARSVSLVSSLGVMLGIYGQVYAETKSARYGLLGAGLFAALFRTCGAFYDLARPDSLMLLLTLGAILMGRRAHSWRGALLAASLMSLAFFTKQTAAVFAPIIAGWLFWRSSRIGAWAGFTFVIATLGLCSVGVLWLNAETSGSFWSYIFEGHQGHVFHWKNIRLRYWRDLIFLAPLTLFLPALWLSLSSRRSPYIKLTLWALVAHWALAFLQRLTTLDYRPHMYYRELWYESPRALILIPPLLLVALIKLSGAWGGARAGLSERADDSDPSGESDGDLRGQSAPRMSAYWLWVFIAGAGASGLNHSTQWAYSNCFMLIALGFSIAAPMMMRDLVCHQRSSALRGGAMSSSEVKLSALWGLIIIQLVAWAYAPAAQVPQARDHRAWSALKTRLARHQAPLFTPAHPTYNALERGMRGPYAVHTHQMGIRDVAYRGGVSGVASRLAPLKAPLKTRSDTSQGSDQAPPPRWSAIMLHEGESIPYLERYYYQAERWRYLSSESLRAKTGHLTRPNALWLPRGPASRNELIRAPRSPLSLNFEGAQARWSELGWRAQGEAFGSAPVCPHRWRGEGRCGARSAHRARGELIASLTLPLHHHISLLARGDDPTRARSGGHLELRLEVSNTPRAMTRLRVHTDGRWRRYVLSPRAHTSGEPDDTPIRVKLSLIDQSSSARLSVDDLKVDAPLDLSQDLR